MGQLRKFRAFVSGKHPMVFQPLLIDLQVFPDRFSKQGYDPCLSFKIISDWVNPEAVKYFQTMAEHKKHDAENHSTKEEPLWETQTVTRIEEYWSFVSGFIFKFIR